MSRKDEAYLQKTYKTDSLPICFSHGPLAFPKARLPHPGFSESPAACRGHFFPLPPLPRTFPGARIAIFPAPKNGNTVAGEQVLASLLHLRRASGGPGRDGGPRRRIPAKAKSCRHQTHLTATATAGEKEGRRILGSLRAASGSREKTPQTRVRQLREREGIAQLGVERRRRPGTVHKVL
ncbi:Hypothetical predicted protein [Podarcis lilfordi]|uniref:Uncharacterized protein n=1 Tax=Podarcis lilfordi TaxID=74358 RepID=A0AA35L1U4_9SAUR|nr:Hypothetical predicted protein [Podarcis lilfordi]